MMASPYTCKHESNDKLRATLQQQAQAHHHMTLFDLCSSVSCTCRPDSFGQVQSVVNAAKRKGRILLETPGVYQPGLVSNNASDENEAGWLACCSAKTQASMRLGSCSMCSRLSPGCNSSCQAPLTSLAPKIRALRCSGLDAWPVLRTTRSMKLVVRPLPPPTHSAPIPRMLAASLMLYNNAVMAPLTSHSSAAGLMPRPGVKVSVG